MPLLTLFSAPKPFTRPHVVTIQHNAIRSWTLLPDVEVILFGDDPGIAEAAQDLGVRHIPGVACNPNGIPLVSSMIQLARQASQAELLCLLNADVILLPDFLQAARQVWPHWPAFVLLGRRWDVDITDRLTFAAGWEVQLRDHVIDCGVLHRPAGSDFFVFPRACYWEVPEFAIGRAGWDNWMIYHARRQGWPVVDITPSAIVIHQNHDYGHLPGGRSHHDHPDTLENIRLAGGPANVRYTILDATHELVNGTLRRPRWTRQRLLRRLEVFLRKVLFFVPENVLEGLVRPQRWQKRFQTWLRRLGKVFHA